MCRDRNNGGRRCNHDSSDNRRNRRQNAKLRNTYIDSVLTPISPNLINTPPSKTVTVDTVRQLSSEYRTLRNTGIVPRNEYDHYNHKHPLSPQEILAERKLIELGAAVVELAMAHGAPTQEEWDDWFDNQGNLEKEYLALVEADIQEMLALTEAGLVRGQNGETPGTRNVEYTDASGNRQVANENDFYIEAALNFADKGDVDKAKRMLELLSSVDNKAQQWNSGEFDTQYNELVSRRSLAYRTTLQEVGVDFAGTDDLNFKLCGNNNVNAKLAVASTMYPKEWVMQSNEKSMMKLSAKKGRAFYSHDTETVQLDPEGGMSVATHELAHRLEYSNPDVGYAERAFLNRRAGLLSYHQGEAESYREATGVKGNREHSYSDNFADAYMGRVYDYKVAYMPEYGEIRMKGTASYELLSMGMETVFYGKHGGGVGNDGRKKDGEYTNFILGLLASTSKKK